MTHQPTRFMRFLWICLFVLCQVPGFAAEEETKMSCRFLCLETTPPPPLICASASGAEVQCKVPSVSLSDETTCFAVSNTITFLSASDRKPAAVAKIPANLKRAILVFVTGPKTAGALPWRVFVIEDSIKNFPDGGAFVVNFHSQDIRCVIGESKILLRPAMSTGVGLPEKRDAFNMAPVAVQFQLGETWRDASETMLRFLPGMRYLVFAYLDSTSGRPKVVTIQDSKVAAPAAP